ncbi:MAG: hypothetical protein L3K13_01860 [Thermoplasmata archaeon]|nr:hypothetical protein [Thermoplasmata archaeon]
MFSDSLRLFAIGFLIEAATEAYQLVGLTRSTKGVPALYYASLATTILGFYVMYLGSRRWLRYLQGRPAGQRVVRAPRLLRLACAFAASLLGFFLLGKGSGGSSPLWFGVLVGGVTVVAFADFFSGLYRVAAPAAGPRLRALLLLAVGWSVVVAVYAGVLLGASSVALLHELVTNLPALLTTFAPVAFAMAGLVLTYVILAGVFLTLRRKVLPGRSSS